MMRLALIAAVLLAPVAAFAADANPLQVIASHTAPPSYTPGQPVEVTVTITASAPGEVTALGLRETIPDTWTFAGMRGVTGDLPAIAPPQGQQGILEFAWITIPPFPYTFAYTLAVPATASETVAVTGQAEYRTAGPQQLSAPDIITMNGPAGGAPKITLQGGASVTVEQGQSWVDPGYTATDANGNDISGSVTTAGGVDTSTPGEYSITYTVRDGAKQASATRNVSVVAAGTNGGTDNGNGNDNGGTNNGGTGGVVNRPYAGGGVGAPANSRANNRNNAAANAANSAANRPQRNTTVAKNTPNPAANGKSANPANNITLPNVVGSSRPPLPKAGLGIKPGAKPAAGATATKAGGKGADDMKELDRELFGGDNTGEVSTDAASTSPPKGTQMASAADGAPKMLQAAAPPRVPGIVERIRMRIGGLGKKEVATILTSLLAVAGLAVFATIAGRIAYAGPVRRAPQKPATAE